MLFRSRAPFEVTSFSRQRRRPVRFGIVRSLAGTEVPAWLNEGVAQWYEGQPGDRALAIQDARARLAGSALEPLAALGGSFALWTDEERIARAYAQSLALIDHISRWYGDHVVLAMLEGCRAGVAPEETFQQRTARTLGSAVVELAEEL